MICPSCGAEYRDGFTECADCHIPLIRKFDQGRPDKPEYLPLVPVFETGSHAALAVAKALLSGAGIRFHVNNETASNLFGVGSFGAGFNPLSGAMVIMVNADDAEEARRVLEDLEGPGESESEDEPGKW